MYYFISADKEVAKALGAIGLESNITLLKDSLESDPVQEVRETCELALSRLEELKNVGDSNEASMIEASPFLSVDPAGPASCSSVHELWEIILKEEIGMYERYGALFGLRNQGGDEAVAAIIEPLNAKSALLRHEVAYVLGQLQNKAASNALSRVLKDVYEHPMVDMKLLRLMQMMSDTIDDVLDDDEAKNETDELTNQVNSIKLLFSVCKEREIRAAEERLLKKDVPQVTDDFEKLIKSSPNNSFIWIKYMAFLLYLNEFEKAQLMAERNVQVFLGRFTYTIDFAVFKDNEKYIEIGLSEVVLGKPLKDLTHMEDDYSNGLISFTRLYDTYIFKMPRTVPRLKN
ncbi:deoxyhypusine hydroxylase [Tanacetum coccineum]